MKAASFEELKIWQNARALCICVYDMVRKELFSKDYRFVSQITAASGSVMDNIAEGFERDGNKEFIQFLYIAKGSCGEVRSQIHRAYDVKYISKEEYTELLHQVKLCSSGIYNFIQTLKDSELKGTKSIVANTCAKPLEP